MIAVLTSNAQKAIDYFQCRGDLGEYSPAKRRGTFLSRREFLVVTRSEQLEGVRLTDYIVIGEVEPGLLDLARARMVI